MIIDILCLGSLALGFWIGYSRGIVSTAFGLLAIFFGLLITFKFSYVTTDLLEKVFGDDNALVLLLGFVLTFVAIMLLVRMLAKGIEKLLMKIKLNILNKVAGGVLLSMIFGMVFSVMLWFFDQAGVVSSGAKQESRTYPTLQDVPEASRALVDSMKPMFQEFWTDASLFIDKIGPKKDS